MLAPLSDREIKLKGATKDIASETHLRNLGVGVIGCGKIAEIGHLPAYLSCPGVQLKGISDVDRKRLSRMSNKFRVADTFTDYNDLLKRRDIDLLSVCVPPVLHHDIVLEAAKQGKHILCEKPFALSVSQAEKMNEAAQNYHVQLYAGFQSRFSATMSETMRLYRSGFIGKISSIYVKCSSNAPSKATWYYDRSRGGGGALFDIGQHPLDMVLHNFDGARLSSASFATVGSAGIDEMANLDLDYGDDLKASIEVDWKAKTNSEVQMRLQGAKGYMLADIVRSTIELKQNDIVLGRTMDRVTLHFQERMDPLWAEVWEFVRSVRDERRSNLLATGEQALKPQELIEEAYSRFFK